MERNWFTFGPYDSRDFGIYITGSGTFDAPEKAYDTVLVPGRNGALILPENRLDNVDLTYPAYIYVNFDQQIAAMRSAFLGLDGYQILTDSYHPNEYRLAYFAGGTEVDPTRKLDAGRFNIEFNCKPQRYLFDGDQPRTVGDWTGIQTTTAEGSVVSFESDGLLGIKDLKVDITPVQNGTPTPQNPVAITGWTGANVTVVGRNRFNLSAVEKFVYSGNHNYGSASIVDGILSIPYTIGANGGICIDQLLPFKTGDVISLSFDAYLEGSSTDLRIAYGFRNAAASADATTNVTNAIGVKNAWTHFEKSFTLNANALNGVNVLIDAWATGNTLKVKNIQVEPGSTATTYEPYQGTTYPISFSTAGTVYGGTLDVTTGVLKARPYYASYSGQTLVGPWVSSKDVYAAGTTPTSGAQVVDLGGAETSYSLTGVSVSVLDGINNIWADTGDVTVEYGADPNKLANPTQQTARPLIRVFGYGTLTVGSDVITIASNNYDHIDIDAEIMDCFCGSTNCNSLVSFSTHEFPVLPPGVTTITYSGNITKVQVEPRWWTA